MPSPPRSWRRTARRRGFICAPRRNSPARNSWPPASAASSNSPRCFATASAARCTIRNSRCVEWYRAGEPYETLMADCAAILARRGGSGRDASICSFRGRSADPFAEPERLTVADAFARFAGIDLLATLPGGEPDRDGSCPRRDGGGHPHRRRRLLGRYFQPRAGGEDRGPSRHRPRHHPRSIPGRAGGTGAAGVRPARRRALRALCLRRGTRQRFWRTHRRRRATPPARTGDGGEGAAFTASATRSTRISLPRLRRCRRLAASRSASTASSCWQPAPRASSRFCGIRWHEVRLDHIAHR